MIAKTFTEEECYAGVPAYKAARILRAFYQIPPVTSNYAGTDYFMVTNLNDIGIGQIGDGLYLGSRKEGNPPGPFAIQVCVSDYSYARPPQKKGDRVSCASSIGAMEIVRRVHVAMGR